MKNLKNICLVILLLLSGFNEMYAQQQQQQTADEQKKDELIIQLWSKYGQRMAQLIVNTADGMSDKDFIEYADSLKNSGVKELAALYGRTTPEIDAINWYAQELKKAAKLKTAVDLQRDNERKLKAEQEAYEKTDAGSIKKNIKTAFEKWNQKGEFEKEADYAENLKTQSQEAFSQICIEQIKSKINNYNGDSKLKRELSNYNSENEFFTVSFKINDVEWQNKINIPIANAENFKNNWSRLLSKTGNYDWCFVENSLCPTLVTLLYGNEKYEFPLSLKNQIEISYSFDDLEIENSHLKGFVFNYSDAKAIAEKAEKEKQRLDSLELATYTQKLDSVFQDYNRQLLQNPYNVERETISEYDKMKSEGNRENNFTRSVSSIRSNFERLNDNFERKQKDEYRKNEKLFANKDEFDTFYIKGNDVYTQEVEKRTVLNHLTANSNFVEAMDFQKEKKESVGSVLGKSLYGVATGTSVSTRDYTNENEARKNILSLINWSKDKPYYPQIMDFVIETNKAMNKEWTKNGHFFESKAEFYNAYISVDYKQVLKDKKKNG
jgi:hypothetical protein